jgi:hypothetical protein
VAQPGAAQAAAHAPVVAVGRLAFDEQPEALLERQRFDLGAVELLGQRHGHAGELQGLELIQGGMVQHWVFSFGSVEVRRAAQILVLGG